MICSVVAWLKNQSNSGTFTNSLYSSQNLKTYIRNIVKIMVTRCYCFNKIKNNLIELLRCLEQIFKEYIINHPIW